MTIRAITENNLISFRSLYATSPIRITIKKSMTIRMKLYVIKP
jgi:hypothetical protein